MQKYPMLDLINAAPHGVWTELLEARGYQWAPLVEPHLEYVGPEADVNCEVIEVGADKTLVLAYQLDGYDLPGQETVSWLLGYQGADDVPTIFSPNAASVEPTLRWVGAL